MKCPADARSINHKFDFLYDTPCELGDLCVKMLTCCAAARARSRDRPPVAGPHSSARYENRNTAAAIAQVQRLSGPHTAVAVIELAVDDQAAVFVDLLALVPRRVRIEIQAECRGQHGRREILGLFAGRLGGHAKSMLL